MTDSFNEEAQEILTKAKLEMLELKHPYVGTEHLVLAILHTENELTKNLSKYNLTYESFKTEILKIIGKGTKKSDFFLHTPLLKKVIENAIIDSKDNNHGIVTINHLFSALLDVGEGIAIRIFIGMNLDLDSMYDEFTSKIYESRNNNKKLLIEEIGTNINKKVKQKEIDPLFGRNKEITKIEEILCRRTKNNPLLIGEPGVGKTAIIEGLATLIEEKKVPNKLQNKIIISIDMASAVAGTKYRGEFEERMKKILEEIEEHDEIILFIDEIHTLIGAGGAEGAIDASNIIKPALARGKIRCIGATTKDEYKKHFEKDKALERRFQIINIEEPTIEETKDIILGIKPIYEQYHNVIISNETVDKLIFLTEKYIYNRYRPDKQIDILDEVCSKVNITNNKDLTLLNNKLNDIKNKKEVSIKNNDIKKAYELKIKESEYEKLQKINNEKKEVTITDVALVISNKLNIPIYEILKDNKKIIKEIETTLKNSIIGQEIAINELIDITKKIKLGYKENKCISFLFIGPSGVGKTKLATTFGNIISKQKPLRFDMSEYADSSAISRFIGSNPGYIGYDENKYALSIIKDNPNSVIILDEIDKANPKIINLLFQILEEGKIKDSKNNIINFNNNIIIMTSNIGGYTKNIGFNDNTNSISNELIETFGIAFINRIDNIIKFNTLNKSNIKKIINIELNKLKEKYSNITININDNVIKEIIDSSNYKELGARKIPKIIDNKIENIIIDNLIINTNKINIDSIFSK